MILHHKEYYPAFGIAGHDDQMPMCLYVVLSINDQVGDCAAYHGIAPIDADSELLDRIRRGGTKISATSARAIFPEIDDLRLRYRP